jgi:aminoglycoside phosphotransferase (APT) family kinase protein
MAGTPLDLAREAVVYRALAGSDLPVPAAIVASDDGQLLLLEHATGDASLRGLDPGAARALSEDYGRQLARLHTLDGLDLGERFATDDLHLWAAIQRDHVRNPATPGAELALDWLDHHRPAPGGPPVLCHGDAGAGNFLHDGERVTALLDWEFAHLGDAHDDLAWVAVRNQVLRSPLDVAAVVGSWHATTGQAVDGHRLEHFRALVLTRMLVSCDAALTSALGDPPAVQSMLRPYLGLAVLEALRRAGCRDGDLDALTRDARARWEGTPIAAALPDPTVLDDLGGCS